MSSDVQLIVIVEQGRFSGVMSCLLAFLLLFSAQPKCFLEVSLLRGKVAALGCGGPLTLLDRFTKVLVGRVAPGCLTRPGSPSFVLVTGVGVVDGRSRGHTIPHASSGSSFFPQPSIVGEEIGDVFGLLTDICALIFAILVNVLEFLEGLDNVDIVTEIDDDVLRAGVQAVIEEGERLKRSRCVSDRPEQDRKRDAHFENMPPVLAFVVQPFIQNLHNLNEVVPVRRREGLTRSEAK